MNITHFSDESWISTIKTDNIVEIHNQLSYFMWETSTQTMMSVGVPTDDDVQNWIDALLSRDDADSYDVRVCITDCLDYIENTNTAFDILGLHDKIDE